MKNIVLVGFMGTGKTVVGRRLSKLLEREFLESDDMIEKKEGVSIKEIFEKKGEPYFRKLEKDVVREASKKKGVIISLGGGAVIDSENLANLKKNGVLICLQASPEVILKRTKNLKTRPLLNVPDPKRAPYYKKVDHSINTDDLSVEEVAESIKTCL